MGFYTAPSFFLALAALVVPAAVLGFAGRSIKGYGLLASCVMLACLFAGSVQGFMAFALFVAVSLASTYATWRSWTRGAKSIAVYRVALCATIAPLVIYKVSAVFDGNLLGFIGISYLTFKAVQVLIEIRDGLIKELTATDYLYFLLWFATFTSGPIDRSRRFTEDAHTRYTRAGYADLLTRGIVLLLIGAVFQLVLATIMRAFYDPASAVGATGVFTVDALGLPAWLREMAVAYGYALYLFFDFAGYSLMAMGASYCFGIRCPRNFRAPFVAVDIKDFWNRWHITLSTWLRDFVFMRFVRAATKRKLFSNRVQTACAGYCVNMLLMGAWHGLTPGYLAYGAYHGVLLAATEVYQKRSKWYKRNRKKGWYQALSWFVTLQLVVIGFALFSGQIHLG